MKHLPFDSNCANQLVNFYILPYEVDFNECLVVCPSAPLEVKYFLRNSHSRSDQKAEGQ